MIVRHCAALQLPTPLLPGAASFHSNFMQISYQPSPPVDYHPTLLFPSVCPLGWQKTQREWFSKCGLGTPFIRIWQPIKNADSWMGPRPNHNSRGNSEAQATF